MAKPFISPSVGKIQPAKKRMTPKPPMADADEDDIFPTKPAPRRNATKPALLPVSPLAPTKKLIKPVPGKPRGIQKGPRRPMGPF